MKYVKFMNTCIDGIFKMASRNQLVADWYQKNAEQWKWLSQWVEERDNMNNSHSQMYYGGNNKLKQKRNVGNVT